MYRYRATPQKSIGRNDLTYGLLAEELIGIKWTAVAVIPDISCDCALVTHLAERCTHGQLAPFQMLDVVRCPAALACAISRATVCKQGLLPASFFAFGAHDEILLYVYISQSRLQQPPT